MQLTKFTLVISALCAFAVFIVTAQRGIGFTNDSFGYLAYADTLRFEGLLSTSAQYTVFPPLYPAILALLGSSLTAIHWLHIVISGLNGALFLSLLSQVQDRNRLLNAAITLAIYLSPTMAYYNASILSEALFLVLLQAALLLYIKSHWRWALLFCALVPLQRFIGVVLIAAIALHIWHTRGVRKAVLFGGITGAPIALWMFRNALLAESNIRTIAWHPIGSHHWAGLWQVAAYWFVPVLLIGLLVGVLNKRSWNVNRRALPALVTIAALYIVLYLAFLVAHISILDHAVPMNGRLLQSVIVAGWLIIAWGMGRFTIRRYRRLSAALVAFVFAIYAVVNSVSLIASHYTGVGLIEQVSEEHVALLTCVPEDITIYSNQVAIVEVLQRTGRDINAPTARLPRKVVVTADTPNPDYATEMAQVIEQVRVGDAVVFYWGGESPVYDLAAMQAQLGYTEHGTLVVLPDDALGRIEEGCK